MKIVRLLGLVPAFIAAVIGAYAAGQCLALIFLDRPADISWEDEKRSLILEFVWTVYLSPLIALFVAAIATPALLLLHHLRRTDCLSHMIAGAITGLLFGSWAASLPMTAVGVPLWMQGAAMGAGGALAFWVGLQLYTGTINWFSRTTTEDPSART